MQHLTFDVSEVCLATRGRAMHFGTRVEYQHIRLTVRIGGQAEAQHDQGSGAVLGFPNRPLPSYRQLAI